MSGWVGGTGAVCRAMLVGLDPVCYHPLDVTAGEFYVDFVRVWSTDLVAWGKCGWLIRLLEK